MPQLIVALFITVISFGSAWTIQSWRFDARELEHVTQANLAQRQAADAAIARERDVAKAQNAAALRLRHLRAAADSSRASLISLSDAADSAMRSAEASHDACLVTAAAERVVLNQCGDRYRSLAEIADRHASDIQMMQEAWQK